MHACNAIADVNTTLLFLPVQVPILLSRYAGHGDGLQRVEEAIRTQQNNNDAVKYVLGFIS